VGWYMITVYVLQGGKKRYVGITNNLARRLAEHHTGSIVISSITSSFLYPLFLPLLNLLLVSVGVGPQEA